MLNWEKVLGFIQTGNPEPDRRIEKTADQWKACLSVEQFAILREEKTEPPFSSQCTYRPETGLYACAACHAPLFVINEKFDSGTGWPSFSQPVQNNAIAYFGDWKLGHQRIEVKCNSCLSHLGHVFPDGPKPTGLRYCINGIAMTSVD